MRNVDLTPLYRSFIGFDHLASLMDRAAHNGKQASYPPYNIEALDQDKYQITMAVAGFTNDELHIESENNTLRIKGQKANKEDKTERKFIHQGIAERNFEQSFQLGDHVRVIGAELENGLLMISLEREIPEALKPRKIEIGKGKLLENEG
ncbi:Hsp20 family protein [Pseudoalteromonas luteoviolacea]|uniref:Heat-shock protein n=1 Tax=Pseudoalteromonas luteoviolacea NCIMB 1942 TaxID=1365253 RepID=A0A167AIT1_9GAMM|nr:Hsp20 family protein [Pseudoalteromonas luteoviolacea]KZN45439.1 heat-shock protein [Pseudoalteromonas luteoviolacea NCIMB 1942]KZX02149.1 heat-shock protein [Pseudoalteromonas luteoviolacea]